MNYCLPWGIEAYNFGLPGLPGKIEFCGLLEPSTPRPHAPGGNRSRAGSYEAGVGASSVGHQPIFACQRRFPFFKVWLEPVLLKGLAPPCQDAARNSGGLLFGRPLPSRIFSCWGTFRGPPQLQKPYQSNTCNGWVLLITNMQGEFRQYVLPPAVKRCALTQLLSCSACGL